MLRFVWLLISLVAWSFIFWKAPDVPLLLIWIPVGISVACYIYGWIFLKENWLIYFFTALIWTSLSLGYGVLHLWEERAPSLPVQIAPLLLGRIVWFLGILISSFLTFSNYRISLNFIQRRGNIDKGQLVRLSPSGIDRWNSFKNLFKRKSKGQEEIYFNLGEEVPFKD